MIMYNDKQAMVWLFKRVVNSEYKEHLVFQLIPHKHWTTKQHNIRFKRQGWNYYEGPQSVEQYLKRMDGNWDNPWIK